MNKIAEKGTEGGEKNASSEQSEDAMGGRDEEEASGKGPRDRFKSIGIVTALRIVTGVIDWKIAERGEKPQPLERQRPGGRLELRGRL